MQTINFTLHSIPDSLNKALRGNRMKYFSKNRKWDILIHGMIRFQIPTEPFEKAHIKIVRHSWRFLDYDGLVGSMKPVIDALVSCGVLIDDNYKVTGPWDVTQQFRPKKDGPLLDITIEQRM